MRGVRLACVKPAASVRSEPGSNSQVENPIWHIVTESTRTSHDLKTSHDVETSVTSHKNVTAKVDLKPELNPVREPRRPRFSFSLFNCQITDGLNRQKLHHTRAQDFRPRTPNSSPHFLRNFRASSSVASSAAALVGERVIVPHQRNSQQGFSEKMTVF